MKQLVILGAGITGISAGYHASLAKNNASIYEEKPSYGGLANNFIIEGFRFDNAIHLSFTKNQYVRSIFDKTPFLRHYPNPYNYEGGVWLKHPVQNNLFPLPIEDRIEAIKGFVERPEVREPGNYYDWLVQQYGSYITDRFPARYTRKYWTIKAEQLSTEWVGNRLYRPSLDEVLFGAMTDDTPNTYYAQEMRYPKSGGYKAFLDPMAEACTVHLNKKAVEINSICKYVDFESGERVYYDNLISTIPLPELIQILKDVPQTIMDAATSLWATSVALVSIGFKRQNVLPYLWFYVYDESFLPSRVYFPSLKSEENCPLGCSSMQFEIYFSKGKPLPMSLEGLKEHVVDNVHGMKLADKKDICIVDCRVVPYANVVFEKDTLLKRTIILDYLKSLDICSAGRFGEWGYLWSDQSLLSGKNAVDKILCLE